MLWRPRSPDITPCEFFLEGYVKDWVFVPPLSRDLAELNARINAAAKNIDAPMLTRVWQELEYCIDRCPVTRAAHIELCGCKKKKTFFSPSFPVVVNNSIKVGPLVFLLQMFVNTETL